jgi:hypothetical protein
LNQLFGRDEGVLRLFASDVSVVTFASFVVEAHEADPRPYKGEPILELVAGTLQRRRNLPEDKLGKGVFAERDALFEE